MKTDDELARKRRAILEETLQEYVNNPERRCIEKSTYEERPAYHLPDGRRCAVGRYLRDVRDVERRFGDLSVAQIARRMKFDTLLREEVRGLDTEFWASLQYLHDCKRFWADHGLTATGWSWVLKLLRSTGFEEGQLPESIAILAKQAGLPES